MASRAKPLDFAAHPIHPAGQLVVSHDPPNQRASWAKHDTRGFYLSPALSHYRSHVVFIPSTLATRITSQLDLFPDLLFTFEDPTISAPPPDPTFLRCLLSLSPARPQRRGLILSPHARRQVSVPTPLLSSMGLSLATLTLSP